MIPINIIYFKNNNVADENTDENIKEYIKEHISPGEFQGGKKLLNLGLYKDTSNVYADVLVGISRLRNKDWEICDSDTAICVTASAGDPILMLNTILNCSQLSNEILEGMLKPFIGPEKSWQDLENKMKKNDKNSSDNFLYGIISDEKEIDISLNPENKSSGISQAANIQNFFEIAVYLDILESICKRDLKQQLMPHEENLTCKIRGRLLIGKQIKYNLAHGRVDRNYCSFNKMSIDTPENRILKYALHLCHLWSRKNNDIFLDRILYCENVLRDVRLQRVTISDIRAIKTNYAFKDYHAGIKSAGRIISKMTICYDGPQKQETVKQTCIKPFMLRMDLLFEIYCYVQISNVLKEIPKWKSVYQEQAYLFSDPNDNQLKGFSEFIKPDIILKQNEGRENIVIDAKYSNLTDKFARSRTHQILAYGYLYCAKKVGFIYPSNEKDPTIREFNSFTGSNSNKRWGFSLPIRLPDHNQKENDTLEALKASLKKILETN